jgi:hypothetical protein
MWRFVSIAFLIAHGAIHLAIWATPPSSNASFDVARSWLWGEQRTLAVTLAVIIGIVIALAGIGLWAGADWWRPVAVAGLTGSLGLMIVFFNPWFLFIQAVNAALVFSLIWLDWPSSTLVGG